MEATRRQERENNKDKTVCVWKRKVGDRAGLGEESEMGGGENTTKKGKRNERTKYRREAQRHRKG